MIFTLCNPNSLFGVFTGVQDTHERSDHGQLADDGQDLFTDTSMVFAKDRHVRVVLGERERAKVNKYGEKCRRAGAVFQPPALAARSGSCPRPHPRSSRGMLYWRVTGWAPTLRFCTGGGGRN
jgi:hypothetical protein